ncbi:MAG: type II toxin-antitoxin system Phd/YefM family antitoxin [Verrucomicrobia bacterium]|nr:type II toxin-antitoxin system Phd/YefM family antitoxin [Verrucomicrobiota bacterium]
MRIVTEKEAVATLPSLADAACESHEPVFIARDGAETVVLISLSDYECRDETEYLLRSPTNAARLLKSISNLRAGIPATERNLIEP